MSDTAIRANRRGRIAVADELVDETEIRTLLSERVSLISSEPDPARRCIWLHGYSDDFDALPLGATAPQYQAVFSIDSSAPLHRLIRLVRFERVTPRVF